MRRFPNEIAVQAMFVKVCNRYRDMTLDGKPYVPMTEAEMEQMMETVIGPKPVEPSDRLYE